MSQHWVRGEVRATLVLAIPLVLVQLSQMAMSFIDVVMVGRLGTEALAAAVLGSTVFFTLALVCVGVILSVTPTVSQAVGAGDEATVGRATRQGLWLATFLGIPFVILLGYAEPLLLWTGQDPEVAALAARYLRAIRWGFVPNLWFTALRGLCEGVARPRPILAVTLLGVGVNVLGNTAFMFGRWGFPALGLEGTGWSSALVMLVMFKTLGLHVRFSARLRGYRIFAGLRRPDPEMLKALFLLGWPIGIGFGLEAGLFTAATLVMGQFGETALAAHQVALNAASVTFMVPLGIGMAGGVQVGQAAGGGDLTGAARAGWTAVGLGASFMACSALLFWLRPEWVVWLYAGPQPDPAVAELAVTLLGVAAVFQLVDGIQASAAGALRGLKDTRVPMWIGAVSYWGLGLSLGAGLGLVGGGGPPGLWWGLTLGLAAAAVLLSARFWRLTSARGSDSDGPTTSTPAD
ncbi:MAG: MATE family efflux transporter [Bacteroidota bacterium]